MFDLTRWFGKTVVDHKLAHFSPETGAVILKGLGVYGSDIELQAASEEVKGHALTLQLMGRYVAIVYHGDIRKRDLFHFEKADAETQGGHAFRVLKKYEDWLSENGVGGQIQLAILTLLGLFDRPADPECLQGLRSKPAFPVRTTASSTSWMRIGISPSTV